MRLGVVVSLFSGEELLEGALKQIRNNVDYIVCVVQAKGNCNGEYWSGGLAKAISLFQDGLIDENLGFSPDLKLSGAQNEINKRNIGIEQCKVRECSHILFCDTDEFYDTEQFAAAKKFIEDNNIDSSACPLRTYYKEPTFQLEPMESYYCPFITKLYEDSKIGQIFPVLVDPTRIPNHSKNFHLFDKESLCLHHYTHIRKDYRRKLENSSANVNWSEDIDDMVTKFDNFKLGDAMPLYPNHKLQIVENKFGIKI